MRIRSLLLLYVLLAGCASVDNVQMPDGSIALQATCYNGKAECMNRAARACRKQGGKYHVLDHEQESGFVAQPAGPGTTGYAGSYETDRLLFRCGAAE